MTATKHPFKLTCHGTYLTDRDSPTWRPAPRLDPSTSVLAPGDPPCALHLEVIQEANYDVFPDIYR